MTIIHIGKKRALPDLCPVCGQTQLPPGKYAGNIFAAFIANAYTYWHAEPKKTWGGIQWYGVCGRCVVGEHLMRNFADTFIGKIAKGPEFVGGTFRIPFK